MMTMAVRSVASGATLGEFGLDGGGQLVVSSPKVERLVRSGFDGLSDAQLVARFDGGWSNGYLVIEPLQSEAGAVVAKFDKNQLRNSQGEWSAVGGGGVLDKLKLAGRTPAGFSVRSSRKVKTDTADIGIAEVDGPDGPQVRVGIITAESGKWDAGFSGEDRKAQLRQELAQKQGSFEDAQGERADALETEIEDLENELEALNSERTAVLTPEAMADFRRQLGETVTLARANKAKQDATLKEFDALEGRIGDLAAQHSNPGLERQIRLGQNEVQAKKQRLRLLREDPDYADEVPEAEAELAQAQRQLEPLLARRAELVPADVRAQLEDLERRKAALNEGDIDGIITSVEVPALDGGRVRAELWGSDDDASDWMTAQLYVLSPGESRDDADLGEDYAYVSGLRGLNKLIAAFGAEEVTAAAGADVTPGNDELHHWWTRGKGRALWVESPEPWTTLVAQLMEHVEGLTLARAKKWASRWFYEVMGFYAGSDLNRVSHGRKPRGKVVGPG